MVNSVPPSNSKDSAKTSEVKSLELPLLSKICCPRFAAIQKGADDTGFVNIDFSGNF